MAPENYRIKSIMEMYGDNEATAKKNVNKSDKNRASYYNMISNSTFGDMNNYDLCIDSSIGVEKTAEIISDYVKNIKTK